MSHWKNAIKRSYWTNIVLFCLTVVTTTVVGAVTYVDQRTTTLWTLRFFLNGLWFSIPLLTILLVHEMGHFVASKRHKLDVTLPYFIPAIPPLGTFGAFIKIRSPITNLRVLMRVGAFGPLFGACVAIPLLLIGLKYSTVLPKTTEISPDWGFGSSILMEAAFYLELGALPKEAVIVLHPIAVAAWFGLFVTSMNLLPMGQLDGGHVIYALFGPRGAKVVSTVVFAALIFMGFAFWPGWFVFGLLIMFLGLNHPAPIDDYSPLDPQGRIIGVLAVILFILTFTPMPITSTELMGGTSLF
jgi:membrane-associated protease RseP (regulator of RpoE activity)